MNAREIIKKIMGIKGITNAVFAKSLNITPAALWDRLDTQPRKGKPRKDIPVSLLSDMVKAMGYKVVIIPEKMELSKDCFVVGDVVTSEKTMSMSGRIKLTPIERNIDLDGLLRE